MGMQLPCVWYVRPHSLTLSQCSASHMNSACSFSCITTTHRTSTPQAAPSDSFLTYDNESRYDTPRAAHDLKDRPQPSLLCSFTLGLTKVPPTATLCDTSSCRSTPPLFLQPTTT